MSRRYIVDGWCSFTVHASVTAENEEEAKRNALDARLEDES